MATINFRLSNIPPITKASLLTTFLLSLLCAAFRYRLYIAQTTASTDAITEQQLAVPFLTVVPAASYLFPWTFVTAAFVQQNIFSVFSWPSSLSNGSWPRHWWYYCIRDGIWNEHGRQRSMSSFLRCVLLFPIYLLVELVCWDTIYLDMPVYCASSVAGRTNGRFMNISGLAGLQCAFLIAFKQLVPEHTVTLFRSPLKIRVKVCELD